MADILSLVSDLKARRTHSKVHGIHVNLTWVWLTLTGLSQVSILVLEKWHFDIDLLLTPALVDGLS